MSVDERAFQKAFEMTNFAYSTLPPHIRQFVEAYEAAKVSEQPDGGTYECHITVGCPSGSKKLELLEQLGRTYKWKTSIIHGDPQLGKEDFFYFTRHAGTFAKMKEQMDLMVRVLKNENVLRQKIEHIIFDTKTGIDTSVPERESGWQPIETAPLEVEVIVFSALTGPVIRKWGEFCNYNHPKFTLWMPIPELPRRG